MDYDLLVGRWLKDIPYIWYISNPEKEGWRKYGRAYIFPGDYLNIIGDTIPFGYGKTFSFMKMPTEGCVWEVLLYFSISRSNSFVPAWSTNDYSVNPLRVNGVNVPLPLSLQKPSAGRERYLTVKYIYDYVGVEIPRFSDLREWSDFIIEEYTPPERPKIKLPIHTYGKSPAKSTKLKKEHTRNLFLLAWYLKNVGKYPDTCLPVDLQEDNLKTIPKISDIFSLRIHIEKINKQQKIVEWSLGIQQLYLYRKIRECIKGDNHRVILTIFADYSRMGRHNEAHQSVLVIDKNGSTSNKKLNLYYFDPWGFSKYDVQDILPDVLDKIMMSKKYTYQVINMEWCPRATFQTIDEVNKEVREGDYSGFCAVWSLWIIDLLLENPNVPYEKLIRYALHDLAEQHIDFRKFIRKYAKSIEKFNKELYKFQPRLELTEDLGTYTPEDREILYKILKSIQ